MLSSAQSEAAHFDEDRPTLLRRVQHFLHAYPTMVPFLVLLIGILAFTVPLPRFVEVEIPATVEGQAPVIETQLQFVALAGNRFFSPFNLSLIVQQVTIIAILGIAQTLVILTAGIDLSVGVIMILCSVVMGRTAVVYGVPLEIAFPLGLLVGLLCGAVNGLIITRLRLPPFIVTLGTWSIFGALNIFYSAQRDHPAAGHRGERAFPAMDRHGHQTLRSDAGCLWLDGTLAERLGRSPTGPSCLSCLRRSSGTCSPAPPSDDMSMRPATIPMPRDWPASTPTGR